MKEFTPRRVPRHAVNWQVSAINGQDLPDSFLVDISVLGARVETSAPFFPRSTVELSIMAPGAETEMRVRARVAWVLATPNKLSRYQMGVYFLRPNWELEKLASH
jgi:hypothetical protein